MHGGLVCIDTANRARDDVTGKREAAALLAERPSTGSGVELALRELAPAARQAWPPECHRARP